MRGISSKLLASVAVGAATCALALPAVATAEPLVLFTTDDEPAAGLTVFQVAADGSLTPAPGSPHATGNGPHGVAVSPDGRFVFVVNLEDDTVSSYSIAADGSVTPINTVPTGSTPTNGNTPTDVAPTPDGR